MIGKCIICDELTSRTTKSHATGVPLRVHCCARCEKKAERNSRYGRTVPRNSRIE